MGEGNVVDLPIVDVPHNPVPFFASNMVVDANVSWSPVVKWPEAKQVIVQVMVGRCEGMTICLTIHTVRMFLYNSANLFIFCTLVILFSQNIVVNNFCSQSSRTLFYYTL